MWPCRPPAIETPPRPVPAEAFIPWLNNASCSRLMFSNPTSSKPRLFPAARHAVCSHSALALHLYLVACNPSSSCRFWIFDHLCSNLFQPRAVVIQFYSCWITVTRSLFFNLFFPPLPLLFWYKQTSALSPCLQFRCCYHSDAIITVTLVWSNEVCLLRVTPLVCSSHSNLAQPSPFFSSWSQRDWDLLSLHMHLFSKVHYRRRRVSPRRPDRDTLALPFPSLWAPIISL